MIANKYGNINNNNQNRNTNNNGNNNDNVRFLMIFKKTIIVIMEELVMITPIVIIKLT